MNLNSIFVISPKTGQPDVSLTLLVVTFLGAGLGAILQMAKIVDNASIALELFYASSALYFGRNLNISKDKSISAGESK